MATKADFLTIWNVSEKNNGVVSWIPTDIAKIVDFTAKTATEALTPIDVFAENIAHTVSNPIDVFFRSTWDAAYKKLLKFFPATIVSSITKAIDLPFATLEKAIEYWINNNVTRLVDSSKWISTKFIANLITGNGETKYKSAQYLWNFVEWIGDVVWTLVKSPFWLAQKIPNVIRKNDFTGGTQDLADWWTKKIKNQRLSEKDYYKIRVANDENITDIKAANDENKVEKKAAA